MNLLRCGCVAHMVTRQQMRFIYGDFSVKADIWSLFFVGVWNHQVGFILEILLFILFLSTFI